MNHDTALTSVRQLPAPSRQEVVDYVTQGSQALMKPEKRRGRPAKVTGMHLCLAIVLCGLEGFGAQLTLWRRICMETVGPFAPVWVVDQAIYNRLEKVSGLMELFFVQVSAWMRQQLSGWQDRSLAPFATQVLALDESTLDAVGRWLPELRWLQAGDAGLLAGRISALFDVRLQQWVRVEILKEASANCKLHARTMIADLQAGVLLLFDRGYLSFPWCG